LQRVGEINENRAREEANKITRKDEKDRKIAEKVSKIKEKRVSMKQWNVSELTTMVSWFKRPGDSKIPAGRARLEDRYILTCNRHEDERLRRRKGISSFWCYYYSY
jgi:hypothetical protein